METELELFKDSKRTMLIVDDEEVNRLLLGNMFSNDYNILEAEDGEMAWSLIQENKGLLSIVLLDLMMPKMNGFDVIKHMQSDPATAQIPFIVLTSEKSMEVESLRLGAADFISKPYDMPEIIFARVDRTVRFFEHKQIISSVERDELTGLYTRRFFLKYCELIDRFHMESEMDGIVADIDQFGLLTEIYGNSVAEGVLKSLSDVLHIYAGQHGGIAGHGEGDVFYLYVTRSEDYEKLTKDINERLRADFPNANIHVRLGIFKRESKSVGLVDVFQYAKIAGDTIKDDYQASLAIYDQQLRETTLFKQRLIYDINQALETEQFVVYYQPKYAIKGERPVLCGAEALVRWIHKDFGFLTPDKYISLFEQNGLIQLVDRFVWKKAAFQVKDWENRFGFTLPVSVNASRIDLFDPQLSETLTELVESAGIEKKNLHVEITESAYFEKQETMINAVKKLRESGFILEMDDFGTGYSALNILGLIPLDVLKLDMSFVGKMHLSPENEKIIEIIMNIASVLQVEVNAEGVETKEQLEKLKTMGCDMVQGFYFSRPVSAEDFEELIKKEQEAGK